MLQLYYAPGTISVAAAIALHEAQVPFDPVRVDFKAAEQTKPPYHAVNPKGRVPALVTGHGILTETGAILDYVAAMAPMAGLIPADPFRAARVREVMYYLASTMHVNHAHKMRGSRWADQQSSWDDMAAKVPQTMTDSATYIETCSLGGPYVLGEDFSLADIYLFVVASWLAGDGVDMAAFPKLTGFLATMRSRPSVAAVVAQGMI